MWEKVERESGGESRKIKWNKKVERENGEVVRESREGIVRK